MLWYKKSRENWIRFGNRNTEFFHAQTVVRRRRNKIAGLNIAGTWCTDEEILKKEALSFFKNLFQAFDHCIPSSLKLNLIPQISPELYNSLLHPVSFDEVKEALFSMNSHKAPGADGFQPIFYKTYWSIVGKDVHDWVSNAFSSGRIDTRLAETLIVPIPKVDNLACLRDFRPISLCNVLLKLISTVLVRRIRPYLDTFIGSLQSSFIPKKGTV